MAPPNLGKRMKGVQIIRPFVYGTTARPFDPIKNPKPEGVPADHTHSWTVFVKGVDDTDITYWVKKVQFKLHDSIPNPNRQIEAVPGQPFQIQETGWGEFEINIRLYYTPEAGEKPQYLWHGLRLHPYGTDAEKELQKQNNEIPSWCYEEQIFNEPYEAFYDILTSKDPATKGKGGKRKSAGAGTGIPERTALIPMKSSPGQPFSREAETGEIRRIVKARGQVEDMIRQEIEATRKKEERIKQLKAEIGV